MTPSPKRLSTFDATLMVMGGIIGIGIFFTPSTVAGRVGSPTAFVGIWALGGLIAMAAAATFAEWGASFPKAGGWYVFLRESFGRLAAFLFAWMVLFVVSTGAIASVSKFAANAVDQALPHVDLSAWQSAISAALIVTVTLVCLAGVKSGTLFQNGIMLIKLGAIATLIFAGLALADPMPLDPALDVELATPSTGGFFAALLPVFFAYGGWQMVCYVAPLVKDPERTLPRAILFGVGGVIVVYVALAFAYERVLGVEGLAAQSDFASVLGRHVFGSAGGSLLSAGLALSAVGWMVVTIFGSPWLYVAMAREGLFFESFEKLSKAGVPTLGLCLQMGLALLYLTLPLDLLVDGVVNAEWIFHGLVAAGLLRYRARKPEAPRPFTSPLYPLAPLIYLATAIIIVVTQAKTQIAAEEYLIQGVGLAILVAGGLVYATWAAKRV